MPAGPKVTATLIQQGKDPARGAISTPPKHRGTSPTRTTESIITFLPWKESQKPKVNQREGAAHTLRSPDEQVWVFLYRFQIEK